MIAVIDTSAFVTLFTVDHSDLNPKLTARLSQVALPHVPDIVDVEFHHALRGLLIGDKISPGRAGAARRLFAQTPKKRLPSHVLTDRIWMLRHNLGAYDASFIALAEALDAPLITCDRKQDVASGHRALVQVFGSRP